MEERRGMQVQVGRDEDGLVGPDDIDLDDGRVRLDDDRVRLDDGFVGLDDDLVGLDDDNLV